MQEALDAALAVGDFDASNPGHHGTPEQRETAWNSGFEAGDPSACDAYLDPTSLGDDGTGTTQQDPTYGTPEQQDPTYGTPEQQDPTYGTPEQQDPTYGTPEQQDPTYGTPEQQDPTYGTPEQQDPTYGVPDQQDPTYGPYGVTTASNG